MNNIKRNKDLSTNIISFLKTRRSIFVKILNLWHPLRNRLFALWGVKDGYFSLKDFFALLLPVSFTQKREIIPKYDEFLNKKFKQQISPFILKDGSISIFNKSFYGISYQESIELINDVIASDQYSAKKYLSERSVVIDAGGNIGTFSVFAANLSPNGYVYAFEPVKKTFELLKKNTHHYHQIKCINAGLGENRSVKKIFINNKSTGGSVFEDSPFYTGTSDAGQGGRFEEAEIMTLDYFVYENKISQVDFIKIDTEGYEANVLRGAKETIQKFRPVIAMSAYHNQNDKKDLPFILKSIYADYICELHNDHEEDFLCYVKNK
ncbi:MAG: FkbM family methyltransferase [Patescibacteria group bacterium]|nr:FkbM family methyltransferase [Patescibacteria group bacterium]